VGVLVPQPRAMPNPLGKVTSEVDRLASIRRESTTPFSRTIRNPRANPVVEGVIQSRCRQRRPPPTLAQCKRPVQRRIHRIHRVEPLERARLEVRSSPLFRVGIACLRAQPLAEGLLRTRRPRKLPRRHGLLRGACGTHSPLPSARGATALPRDSPQIARLLSQGRWRI
jgi:hypothetical protein